MIGKLYLLDIGFVEDTVIYELVPKEVRRLNQATVDDIVEYLRDNDIRTVVIDSAQPNIIDRLRQRWIVGRILKTLRLPPKISKNTGLR